MPIPSTVKREAFLLSALKILRRPIPYLWNGKDPERACDCSGLVTGLLKKLGGPDLTTTHNTDRLWLEFPKISELEALPGDLVLYRGQKPAGPEDMEHVMIYAGAGVCFGQAFGGSANTSIDFSLERGHVTQVLSVDYRGGRAGFVRSPLV